MERYGHGPVIGTFCPPHAGHHHLVRTAEDRREALTVMVCTAAGELAAARTRARWTAEVHPRARVVRSVRARGRTVVLGDGGPGGLLGAAADAVDAFLGDTFLGEDWGPHAPPGSRW